MKTILTADWGIPTLCVTVSNMSRAYGRQCHVARADDFDEAVALLPMLRPSIVISQPALFAISNYQILRVAKALQPVPHILVWWASRSAVNDLKKHGTYGMQVTYVELPCPLTELRQILDELMAEA
jgi:hypothetical protein